MTISAEYLEQQKLLHQNPDYGIASLQYAPLVIQLANQSGAKSISDYGAGKCNLNKKMNELGRSDFNTILMIRLFQNMVIREKLIWFVVSTF